MPECVRPAALAKIPACKKMRPPNHHQRTKNLQNNAFCFPLIGFSHKVYNIRIEKQISISL